MKNLIILPIFILLIMGCQKGNKDYGEDNSIRDEKTEKKVQNVDTVKIKDKTMTDIKSEPAKELKNAKQKPVEKLPKIKPTEFSSLMSKAELWDAYNSARAEVNWYKENWDFKGLVNALNRTAKIAQKLERPDIASWQFNNIGYYAIVEFKNRTDYTSRMKDIEVMPYGKEKVQYINETKENLRSEMDLLTNAMESLYDAIELDNQAPDMERQKIINSNINFINSIKEFVRE